MENPSAAELVRQSEGQGSVPADPARVDRRRFLKSGALTVAGLATLSGVELVEAPLAMAQLPTTTVAPVQNFELLSAGATPVPGFPSLHVCRHHYRFDYTVGQAVPPDLVSTYRLNLGGIGGQLADQLQVLAQPAPFNNPSLAPANFPPQPQGLVGGGVNPSPQSLLGLSCYRLTQVTQQPTFPPRTTVRVWDWCSLYCYPGNVIVIVAGDRTVCYRVGAVQPQPPQPQKNIVDDRPTLSNFWAAIQSGTGHSIGGVYYYTYNSQTGAVSTAVWRAQLNVPEGTQCRVDAHIPGSSAPQNRTAGARYQIFNAGFISANVVRSQQLAQSQWVTLGTFPFRPGTFEVHLTDETGEPRASRIVVADAIRWVG